MSRVALRNASFVVIGLTVCCAVPTSRGDPPPHYSDALYLLGSSVYNPDDWSVDLSPGGLIALQGEGLTYRPTTQGSATVRHQLIREVKAINGEIWARYRLSVSDIETVSFFLGLWPEHVSPFDIEPGWGAWFEQAAGSGQVRWHVKEGQAEQSGNGPVLGDDTDYDFVIHLQPNGINTKVQFWWRTAEGAWDPPTELTTATPGVESALRLSAAVKTTSGGEILTLKLFEFMAESQPSFAPAGPAEHQMFRRGSLLFHAQDDPNEALGSDWYVDLLYATMTQDPTGTKLLLSSSAEAALQLKRRFYTFHGKAFASFRVSTDLASQVEFLAGLYSLDADPYDGEPQSMACFRKVNEEGMTFPVRVYAKSCGSQPYIQHAFDMVSNTEYDLAVE
jgi:hypothetical protein